MGPLSLGPRVNATVRHLASSSPSLVPIFQMIPRQLKYETLQYTEIGKTSLLALLSTESEDVTEEPMSLALGHHCSLHRAPRQR
ncbi:hypothetical protein D6D28_05029 [Aureobasidium pullulans]|uniref:Uncharacterized protein n=1 Tax=Aureobasidium pullulans TaxID=5580 RepID=A0A4S8SIS1_AURPU|nr:hypothetical protein D6D28_05029 [Aureobasidium pullulans]